MTVLHPCLHCHRRDGCGIRTGLVTRLKGSGITKATVKCKIPEQDFPPGSVVMVQAFEIVENQADYAGPDFFKQRTDRRGVVRGWRSRLCQVILDKDAEIEQLSGNPIAYLKVPSDHLTLLAEPVRELCACGLDAERCENSDYPSVREGEWRCKEDGPSGFFL
jgi:hypothetical protein